MSNMVLFFLYIFTFVTGVCSLLFSIFFYYKNRLRLWLYYVFFFSVISLKIFLNCLLLYIKLNLQFEMSSQLIIFSASLDLSYLLIFVFPFLFHSLLEISFRKKLDGIFLAVGLAALLLKLTPYIFSFTYLRQYIYIYFNLFRLWLLIFILFYSFLIVLINYRKIHLKDNKELTIISIIFLCFIVLDTEVFAWLLYKGPVNSIHYWLNSIYYLIWCILILLHAMKHYHKYPESPPSMDLNERFIKFHGLSDKECEIVRMILDGKSNRQIGEKLFISIKTVKNHIYNIYQKTGVKNRMELSFLIRNS